MNRTVWQIAAGRTTRSYEDVFLEHGVALIGPGDAGPWSPQRAGQFKTGFVRRFATEIRDGDLVLLRTGIATITAVGIVSGEYEYIEAFDDVNGWDLQHARRMRWCRLPEPHTFENHVFGANPARCSRVQKKQARDFAERFLKSPPTHWQTAPLPALPSKVPLLETPPDGLADLIAQAADILPMARERARFGDPPSEDEMIAHFVVPLLRSLGWRPEKIAVQWTLQRRRIDLAVFRSLPRVPENCHLIIEAKRFGAGVEGALDQAKRYVRALGVARDIILTDGIRYRMYSAAEEFEPVAYANLLKLKRSAMNLFDRMRGA